MTSFVISAATCRKLQYKHGVSSKEIAECFESRCGNLLIDDREDHRRHPPTLWFVAPTRKGRLLKVVFQHRGRNSHIITAYEPNPDEIRIYENKGK